MDIVVLIKQVPDTWSERKLSGDDFTLDREAADAVLDEINERAVEAALQLQEAQSGDTAGTVTVVCMGPDRATDAIMLYIEGVKDARRFLSGLRAASRIKPVIVIKGGRQQLGAGAAVSHTGTLIGSDAVFDAVYANAVLQHVTDPLAVLQSGQTVRLHSVYNSPHPADDVMGIMLGYIHPA